MNFRATYKELSSVASFFGERQLLLKYDGVNQFSLHTKESVFLFSCAIICNYVIKICGCTKRTK